MLDAISAFTKPKRMTVDISKTHKHFSGSNHSRNYLFLPNIRIRKVIHWNDNSTENVINFRFVSQTTKLGV